MVVKKFKNEKKAIDYAEKLAAEDKYDEVSVIEDSWVSKWSDGTICEAGTVYRVCVKENDEENWE